MTVKVCDMIMGAGKTEAAITQMNEDTESRYIFITPYLNEVDRIKHSCADREFVSPVNFGDGKLSNLHTLLAMKRNIASTHALFRTYNDETISLIREGGYKLVLDEVFDVVEVVGIHKDDLKILRDSHIIDVSESAVVEWKDEKYEGGFVAYKDMIKTGNAMMFEDKTLFWTFPVTIFEAFREVIILTYLFDAQIQKYYFDMHGVQIQKIGTVFKDGKYRLSDQYEAPPYVKELKDKIHVVDVPKLNLIGDDNYDLSVSWYEKSKAMPDKPRFKCLKKNLHNVFQNRFKASSAEVLWTTFKPYKEYLKGRGYTNGFLSYNVRATNLYRDRKYLAFCVNVFFNPFLKRFFENAGVDVKEDEFALSEMVQWIWRSAIRDGNEVWIYVPSLRMRELLIGWLDELAK